MDDFTVTTLADVAMIIPITKDNKVVLVKQFKPGIGDVILEFPAGRAEKSHKSMEETAKHELEEETGIRAKSLEYYATVAPFVTKGTERIYCYLAENVEFNAEQKLDPNEEIEVVVMTFRKLEELISSNQLQAAATIAAWELAKKKFPDKFSA